MTQFAKEIILYSLFGLSTLYTVAANSTIKLNGEASVWAIASPANPLSGWLGGRLLYEMDYLRELAEKTSFDMELSANLFGSIGFRPFDSSVTETKAVPYRFWGRYSGEQFEARVGLQKINFGSATLLRPLQWFDAVDPRDPLQLTDGVWGLLGRYYSLNNTNLWIWALYGNKGLKGIDQFATSKKYPELGGRFQTPAGPGEIALSYNFRMAEVPGGAETKRYAENRIGLDGKWDVGVGIWFEACIVKNNDEKLPFPNQEYITGGLDYTFDVGDGLNAVFEHLISSYDKNTLGFEKLGSFSAVSMSYPLGVLDNINGVFTFDWKNDTAYNFISFKRAYDDWTIYVMAFANPKISRLPTGGAFGGALSGKGAQIMVVYNW